MRISLLPRNFDKVGIWDLVSERSELTYAVFLLMRVMARLPDSFFYTQHTVFLFLCLAL
jgi:hypothetical protein